MLERVDATARRDLRAEARVGLPVHVHGARAVQRRGKRRGGGRVEARERRGGRGRRRDGVPVEPLAVGLQRRRRRAREGARGRDSRPPKLGGVRRSVDAALRAAAGGGRDRGRGRGRRRRACPGGLLLSPRGLLVSSVLFSLLPVGLGAALDAGRPRRRRRRVGAVKGVASLPVGAVQGQREGDSAVAELTWTDAGGPEGATEGLEGKAGLDRVNLT